RYTGNGEEKPALQTIKINGGANFNAVMAEHAQIMGVFRLPALSILVLLSSATHLMCAGNDSNLVIVFYVQIMPDDLVMQLHTPL
ncbi:hypothetical protein, partial [Klebsiella pneumoniae]